MSEGKRRGRKRVKMERNKKKREGKDSRSGKLFNFFLNYMYRIKSFWQIIKQMNSELLRNLYHLDKISNDVWKPS